MQDLEASQLWIAEPQQQVGVLHFAEQTLPSNDRLRQQV